MATNGQMELYFWYFPTFKYLHFAKWKLDKLEMTTKTALDLPQEKRTTCL